MKGPDGLRGVLEEQPQAGRAPTARQQLARQQRVQHPESVEHVNQLRVPPAGEGGRSAGGLARTLCKKRATIVDESQVSTTWGRRPRQAARRAHKAANTSSKLVSCRRITSASRTASTHLACFILADSSFMSLTSRTECSALPGRISRVTCVARRGAFSAALRHAARRRPAACSKEAQSQQVQQPRGRARGRSGRSTHLGPGAAQQEQQQVARPPRIAGGAEPQVALPDQCRGWKGLEGARPQRGGGATPNRGHEPSEADHPAVR